MFGFHIENKEKKSKLRPIANGNKPRIVVTAVNITGLSLATPPSIKVSLKIFISRNAFGSIFNSSFLEFDGSHLSKKIRETISVTDQRMPSLILFMVPSYDEATNFRECEFHGYQTHEY